MPSTLKTKAGKLLRQAYTLLTSCCCYQAYADFIIDCNANGWVLTETGPLDECDQEHANEDVRVSQCLIRRYGPYALCAPPTVDTTPPTATGQDVLCCCPDPCTVCDDLPQNVLVRAEMDPGTPENGGPCTFPEFDPFEETVPLQTTPYCRYYLHAVYGQNNERYFIVAPKLDGQGCLIGWEVYLYLQFSSDAGIEYDLIIVSTDPCDPSGSGQGEWREKHYPGTITCRGQFTVQVGPII